MFDLRILKCSRMKSVRGIILIYIKPRCSWYVLNNTTSVSGDSGAMNNPTGMSA